jgi:hypothetical protein
MRTFIIILLIIGLATLSYSLLRPRPYVAPTQSVTSFEECVALGYPVLETFPQQCQTPDGNTFIKKTDASVAPTQSKDTVIQVSNVTANQIVQSPLVVRGTARGPWYFEASFPVKLVDANNVTLATGHATAQKDWMTSDFVPFQTTELIFSTPSTSTGTLILSKDNPSGDPKFDDELRIPVRFSTKERSVLLYYYDSSRDKDASGNVLCSAQGLVAVPRTIALSQTPLQDTLRLFLKGEITPTERNAGITTEYPLPGVELVGASLSGTTLTVSLKDPQHKTSGGSCRVAILKAQLEATVKQFSGVRTVVYSPTSLFQP